ncbi:MAG: N-6 DNA methylase [Candidatus Methanoperedens sp.]
MAILSKYIKEVGLSSYLIKADFNKNTYYYDTNYGKIYFTDIDIFSKELFDVHKNIWCENKSEIFITSNQSQIFICDSKTKPSEENTLQNVKIKAFSYAENDEKSKDILELFKKEKLDSTAIWGDIYSFIEKRILDGKRKTVDEDLLENLIEIKINIIALLNNVSNPQIIAQKLIDRCLFIRFLEDRINSNGLKQTLKKKDVKALVNVFDYYNDSLNGDLFEKNDIPLEINNGVIKELDKIFGDVYQYKSGQQTLSPYQFDKIPITLISNIYEKFLHQGLRNQKGIVYTPENLVEYMTNKLFENKEVYNKIINREIRILDPACGSGIFLVKFLEKSIDIIEEKENRELKLYEISNFIKKSIYGIDTDENALRVAAFSMYLKIFERIAPSKVKEIIEKRDEEKFMFPGLKGNNLLNKNTLFDDFGLQEKFDLILGNPPWGYKFPKPEKMLIKKRWPSVSKYQSSQCFLFRFKDFLKKDGLVALVVNSSNFLNEKSEKFRKEFIGLYSIFSVISLSNVKDITFGKQSEPASIIIFTNKRKNNKSEFVTLQLSKFSFMTKVLVERSHNREDCVQEEILSEKLNWTPYVNGNNKYLGTINNLLRNSLTLKFFSDKCEVGIMKYSEKKHNDKTEFNKKYFSGKSTKGWYPIIDSLTGITNFTEPKIDKYTDYSNANFDRARSIELFEGSKLILTRSWPIRSFIDTRTVIYDGNFIIFKPKKEYIHLLKFFNYLMTSKISFFYFNILFLQRSDGNYAKVNKNSVLTFPIPNMSENLLEEINKQHSEPKIQELIYEAYNLDYKDYRIIEDFYEVCNRTNKMVNESDIELYIDEFKKGYSPFIEQNQSLIFKFYFSDFIGSILKLTISDREANPFKFIRTKYDKLLGVILKYHISKDIISESKKKIYDEKDFYIFKSNNFKDWTQSKAIDDVSEEIGLIYSKLATK